MFRLLMPESHILEHIPNRTILLWLITASPSPV